MARTAYAVSETGEYCSGGRRSTPCHDPVLALRGHQTVNVGIHQRIRWILLRGKAHQKQAVDHGIAALVARNQRGLAIGEAGAPPSF